jgi:hypothetical protein
MAVEPALSTNYRDGNKLSPFHQARPNYESGKPLLLDKFSKAQP